MSAFGKRGGMGGGGRPELRRRQADEGRPGGRASARRPSRRRPVPAARRARADRRWRRCQTTGRRAARRDGPPDRAPERQRRAGSSKAEGFEASVHQIKEQVLPRLLERVDPEAAATLSKDELAEEFRPIIGEVLAELKITLNRREQFALEKVLVDELLGLGPLEELLADPDDQRHHGQRPRPDLHRTQGQARDRARSSSATRSICSRSPSASSTRSAAASTRPRRWPTPASRTAAASTSSSRRCRCAAPPSRFVNSPRSRSRST